MTRIRVRTPPSDAPRGVRGRISRAWARMTRRRGVGSCFTGGVDSFYSLVTNPDVSGLVYAFGLDIPLDRKHAARRVHSELREISAATGDDYLWLRTNLREQTKGLLLWGTEAHGAVLASIGMVLSPVISTLRIPSTHPPEADIPWGSHPDLDPLWSTDRLRVVHDGDATRTAKMVRLADDPLAQRYLRVCFLQFRRSNCGRCMKCMRTMATLTLLDRLDRFTTFERPLDLERLRGLQLTSANDHVQMVDVLRLADTVPGHDELKDVVRSLVEDYEQRVFDQPTTPSAEA